MKFKFLVSVILVFVMVSCNNDDQKGKESTSKNSVNNAPQKFNNEGHKLVYEMVQEVGDIHKLWSKKNVTYTYTYQTPDGKADVSTEKYIFSGELSYGLYKKHERTFPSLEGEIEQGYDGNEYWLKHNGTSINDDEKLKRVAFNRPTNFYWFTMMQKLLNPALIYEYIGDKVIDGTKYNVVKISFKTKDDKPTDTYQIYINKETKLVDQFLFTVADFGKMEPLLMKVEYENIDGILLPTKRKYKQSNWDAEETDKPWINVTWSDIKFDTNITKKDFKK